MSDYNQFIDEFVVITWPEIQELMEYEGFQDNSLLINDGKLYEQYGDSAYMVNKDWLLSGRTKQKYKMQI